VTFEKKIKIFFWDPPFPRPPKKDILAQKKSFAFYGGAKLKTNDQFFLCYKISTKI